MIAPPAAAVIDVDTFSHQCRFAIMRAPCATSDTDVETPSYCRVGVDERLLHPADPMYVYPVRQTTTYVGKSWRRWITTYVLPSRCLLPPLAPQNATVMLLLYSFYALLRAHRYAKLVTHLEHFLLH